MSQRRSKAIRRTVRKNQDRILVESLANTLKEPWPQRLQTGVYIATGGKIWVARLVVLSALAGLGYGVYTVLRAVGLA